MLICNLKKKITSARSGNIMLKPRLMEFIYPTQFTRLLESHYLTRPKSIIHTYTEKFQYNFYTYVRICIHMRIDKINLRERFSQMQRHLINFTIRSKNDKSMEFKKIIYFQEYSHMKTFNIIYLVYYIYYVKVNLEL